MTKLRDRTRARGGVLRRLLIVPVIAGVGFVSWITWLGFEPSRPSRCSGTAVNGSLEFGRRLPYAGDNFQAYSLVGFLSGRTFVHGSVRNAVLASYASVAKRRPELRYLYAEGSWPWGGRIWPHRTHANGTSLDFHVPVRTGDGKISELPASVFNRLGYSITFDNAGRSGDLQIDFEAMALHLAALDRAARENGISISRVIFDSQLQRRLFATEAGSQLSSRMSFKGEAWVRHDQHYHVDFDLPCR